MANSWEEFRKARADGDPRKWATALFGDRSLFCRAMWAVVDEHTMAQGATELLSLHDPDQFKRWLGTHDARVAAEACSVTQGVGYVLRAADLLAEHKEALFERPSDVDDCRSALTDAQRKFEEAWGEQQQQTRQGAPGRSREPTGLVARAMALPEQLASPLGYWIVRDLLDRWITSNRTDNPRDSGKDLPRSATTPILGADRGGAGGTTLWLTVELFLCENGPFCPDPMYLGLTAITSSPQGKDDCSPKDKDDNSPKTEDDNFLLALHHAWEMSKLGSRYRARWRVTSSCPTATTGRHAEPQYIPRLIGRSAEAATLAALLAACGDPYGKDDARKHDDPAEPLADDIAITAKLGERDSSQALIDAPLKPVFKMSDKLDAAKKVLDTVVLAKGQALTEELREVKQAQENAYHKGTPYGDLHIAEARTVGDALDTLLVTNRYLKCYQADVAKRWLSQWQTGTANYSEKTEPKSD